MKMNQFREIQIADGIEILRGFQFSTGAFVVWSEKSVRIGKADSTTKEVLEIYEFVNDENDEDGKRIGNILKELSIENFN